DVPAPPAATEPQQAGGDGDGAGGGNGDGDGAAAGGGGSEEKETKAPEKTAATAVQQMAAEEPGKRHICYRIYVADQGWSDAVCDGETAGEEGSGKPTTAVNIAVSGTKGTSSAAYVYDPASTNGEGHFPDPWASATDGVDNYVGSTEKDAPHMLGFTINVDGGAGTVCQNSYVHNDTWIGLACDDPGTGFDFTYVGTHDNDLWIEAVRLTV
ncbi:hydrolase, partial [Streptomyces sp. NPDC015220]